MTEIRVYRLGRTVPDAVPIVESLSWQLTTPDDPAGVVLPGGLGMVPGVGDHEGQLVPATWRRGVFATGMFIDVVPYVTPATTDALGAVVSWGDVQIPVDYYALAVREEIEWMTAADWHPYREAYRQAVDPAMPELRPDATTLVYDPPA